MTALNLWSHARAWCTGLACLAFAAAASAQTPPLELYVLGSGGPGATGRAASGYLVLLDGVPRILVDAGPGAFLRLGESGLSLARVDLVLLTHLHADHAGDLPGLFKARAVGTRGNLSFAVYGPQGSRGGGDAAPFPSTRRFVDLLFGKRGAFAYLPDFAATLHIEAKDIDTTIVADQAPHTIYARDGLAISAIPGHHRDAPAVIYRVDYGGRSITFSGDIDAAGLPNLQRIAHATDLLVFNCVVLDPPGSPPVLYTLHSPPRAIGMLAAASGARRLLLSHLAPAVERARDAVAASIARSYPGPTAFAEDGLRLAP